MENKIHRIASFYKSDLNSEVVDLQRRIFETLEIPLEQISFEDSHSEAIDRYLSHTNFDSVTLFDIDCIPLNKDVVEIAKALINDETIYGNAQITTYLTPPFVTFPFVAPSFISFTRNLYETSPEKSFYQTQYPYGSGFRTDVAEAFVKANLDRGKKMILSYPVESRNYKWRFDGDNLYQPFKYGNGTRFDNNTYHEFEIRNGEEGFINYARQFLESCRDI
jgi:hypothetical protein